MVHYLSTIPHLYFWSLDFYLWSSEHGARWINEMCMQFNLQPPRNCSITGIDLLGMSQKDFEMILPAGGDTLHAQLQVWKTGTSDYVKGDAISMTINHALFLIVIMTVISDMLTRKRDTNPIQFQHLKTIIHP